MISIILTRYSKPNFIPIELDDLGTIVNGIANVKQGLSIKEVLQKPVKENVVYTFRFKTSHAKDAMLMVIKTPQGEPTVMFQSDMFNPDDTIGRSLSPIWAIEFSKEVKKYGLNTPNTILCGGHAGYAPLSQLFNFVGTQIKFMFKGFVFFQSHKRTIQSSLGIVILIGIFSIIYFLGRFI